MKEVKIYYIRESLLQSIISDTYSFVVFSSLLLFNHKMLDGRWYIDVFFLAITVMVLSARSKTKQFNTNEELIEYLKEGGKDETTSK